MCPYLTAKIPTSIYTQYRCLIVHPGPIGDRGPSSLDWAIQAEDPIWGVTVLQATDELDAGPVWASNTFVLPLQRKSDVYNGVVAEHGLRCLATAVEAAADPSYVPTTQAQMRRPIAHVRTRPLMRQSDRRFEWSQPAEEVLRQIRAGDGSPGVAAELEGLEVYIFDAHPGRSTVTAMPGTVIARRHHAVEVACGRGTSIWIGHLRARVDGLLTCKAPAVDVLEAAGKSLSSVIELTSVHAGSWTDIDTVYSGDGAVATVTFEAYNGAISTDMGARLTRAIRAVADHNVRVLILQGRGSFFSTGIHLGAVEVAPDPCSEAWRNLEVLNELCRTILTIDKMLTVAVLNGDAAAGGLMIALATDVVIAAETVSITPSYRALGLTGAELHSYILPRRVGQRQAVTMLESVEPIDGVTAVKLGLVDIVGPAENFSGWARAEANRLTSSPLWGSAVAAKSSRLSRDQQRTPLSTYERNEMHAMASDIFGDRRGFAQLRRNLLYKNSAPRSQGRRSPHPQGRTLTNVVNKETG